jgi:hypothetical protein
MTPRQDDDTSTVRAPLAASMRPIARKRGMVEFPFAAA